MKEDSKKLVIIGNGETAILAYEYFTKDSDYDVVAFSVHKKYIEANNFLNLPLYPIEELDEYYGPNGVFLFVAISSVNLNRDRTKLYQDLKAKGYKFASYISSHSFIWDNVEIGENCFILEDNTLQPFVKIGNNVTLWSGNHIGHRTVIKDNCFITSHVVVSGFCIIGKNCFIGVNVSIADKINIGNDCLISLGSVISKDTEDNSIYKGNLAKKHIIPAKKFYNINS